MVKGVCLIDRMSKQVKSQIGVDTLVYMLLLQSPVPMSKTPSSLTSHTPWFGLLLPTRSARMAGGKSKDSRALLAALVLVKVIVSPSNVDPPRV